MVQLDMHNQIQRLRAALERIKKWADNPEPGTMLKAENVRCERSEFHE